MCTHPPPLAFSTQVSNSSDFRSPFQGMSAGADSSSSSTPSSEPTVCSPNSKGDLAEAAAHTAVQQPHTAAAAAAPASSTAAAAARAATMPDALPAVEDVHALESMDIPPLSAAADSQPAAWGCTESPFSCLKDFELDSSSSAGSATGPGKQGDANSSSFAAQQAAAAAHASEQASDSGSAAAQRAAAAVRGDSSAAAEVRAGAAAQHASGQRVQKAGGATDAEEEALMLPTPPLPTSGSAAGAGAADPPANTVAAGGGGGHATAEDGVGGNSRGDADGRVGPAAQLTASAGPTPGVNDSCKQGEQAAGEPHVPTRPLSTRVSSLRPRVSFYDEKTERAPSALPHHPHTQHSQHTQHTQHTQHPQQAALRQEQPSNEHQSDQLSGPYSTSGTAIILDGTTHRGLLSSSNSSFNNNASGNTAAGHSGHSLSRASSLQAGTGWLTPRNSLPHSLSAAQPQPPRAFHRTSNTSARSSSSRGGHAHTPAPPGSTSDSSAATPPLPPPPHHAATQASAAAEGSTQGGAGDGGGGSGGGAHGMGASTMAAALRAFGVEDAATSQLMQGQQPQGGALQGMASLTPAQRVANAFMAAKQEAEASMSSRYSAVFVHFVRSCPRKRWPTRSWRPSRKLRCP